MDEELRILHEAMVIKERLRVLADLQSEYWNQLTDRGFESGTAEQLVVEWSRHAYGMTFRALPEPALDTSLDELLGNLPVSVPGRGAQPPSPGGSDPSRVPPGEAWLQLVQDADAGEHRDLPGEDQRAA